MKKNYILEDLDCANCAVKIDDEKEEEKKKQIKKIVKKIEPDTTLKEL